MPWSLDCPGAVVLADVSHGVSSGKAVENDQAGKRRSSAPLAAAAGHLNPLNLRTSPQVKQRISGIGAVDWQPPVRPSHPARRPAHRRRRLALQVQPVLGRAAPSATPRRSPRPRTSRPDGNRRTPGIVCSQGFTPSTPAALDDASQRPIRHRNSLSADVSSREDRRRTGAQTRGAAMRELTANMMISLDGFAGGSDDDEGQAEFGAGSALSWRPICGRCSTNLRSC